MRVGRNQRAVDVEVKELLFVGTYHGREGRRDDRRPQIRGRLEGIRAASNEEFVVNVLRREGVQGEARVAAKVCTLR